MITRLSRNILFCVLVAVPLAMLPACQPADNDVQENLLQSVSLSLSVGSNYSATKADVSSFTELKDVPEFRGMSNVRIVPFSSTTTIVGTDIARSRPVSLPDFAANPDYADRILYPNINAYLYPGSADIRLPAGTSSVLLYGRAPGDITDANSKHLYGSLELVGFSGGDPMPKASSLGFAPDVMFKESSTPAAATTIAEALNAILLNVSKKFVAHYTVGTEEKTVEVPVYWNEDTGDENLRETYLQITNSGALISGSGPMAESLLTSLYSMLKGYESYNTNFYEVEVNGIHTATDLSYKVMFEGLRDEILAHLAAVNTLTVDVTNLTVTFTDPIVGQYPESMGLPSGCAVLRWTPTGFVVPPLSGGVEGLAPMNRYCFPPALYYFANSTIRTAQEENVRPWYDGHISGYTQWPQVLADYKLGATITSSTKAIALTSKAQFAVGMISATVKASKALLPDNDGLVETTVDASGTKLPVTGLIVGRQYAQSFDFKPVYSADGEYFLYDNQIPGVYLTTATSNPIRTLSFQTPDGYDAYFCLELQNETGSTFYGADGRILPGRKFYLVGKLELPATPREYDSVVVQDRITTIDCTISSLAGAYNAIPDLGKPQLALGIQAQVNWQFSTPTTLMLE